MALHMGRTCALLRVIVCLSWFLLLPCFVRGLSADGKVLLRVKASLQDADGVMKGWSVADETPCSWNGVRCDQSNQVTEVDLDNGNLTGPVPPIFCELPKLTKLVLSLNYLSGQFPPGLLDCSVLEHLDLSYNLIVDVLPVEIAKLSSLTVLDLSYNNFSGMIPPNFGDLRELKVLNLSANLLEGSIPPHLGNLSNLVAFEAGLNFFDSALPAELGKLKHLEILSVCCSLLRGPIPASLGNTNLTVLYLAINSLFGSIPSEIGKLKRLVLLDLSNNSLNGSIPLELMFLPDLFQLQLYNNNLTGEIPKEIGNLTSLTEMDFSENQLSGPIPDGLSTISSLELLHLQTNFLSGGIPASIGSLSNLYEIRLFHNLLTGRIPANLGAASKLVTLDVSTNSLSGPLPVSLCAGGALQQLIVFNNNLDGPLPEDLGNCPSLQRMRLENNQLNGAVPGGLLSSPNVKHLDLSYNNLEGTLSFGKVNSSALEALYVNDNRFSGALPAEIGSLPNLITLSASANNLDGILPKELGNLSSLSKLELGNNHFTGFIPSSLSMCPKLSTLNLSSNNLHGEIPPQLGSLPALNVLDLSHNLLSGPIPRELGNLQLSDYNFSFNNFSGELPQPFNSSPLPLSFIGNPGLCGAGPQCSKAEGSKKRQSGMLAWVVGGTFAAAALILVVGGFCFWKKYHTSFHYWSNKHPNITWSLTSFQKVNFSEEEVMARLDEDNVIGSGGSGKVYKVTLSDGQTVAVKKLWTSPKGEARNDNGFRAEVETLGKIRHRNIVKLLCCCTNQKSNLLVYEYMPNGSVGDILHSAKAASILDWPTRYKIAVGAAEGLAYLHHDCVPHIVHRDVKSNNILLDVEFEAHVADFGLAKLFETTPDQLESMSAVAGSYGYIAPEYGYTLKVTEKSDIYSFGVVLLELVTGRRPLEPEFGDGDIVKWVTKKIETKAGALEVLDEKIRATAQEDMMLLLKVGLLCTTFLPSHRPSMRDVVQMLLEACPKTLVQKHRKGSKPSKDSSNFSPSHPVARPVSYSSSLSKWDGSR